MNKSTLEHYELSAWVLTLNTSVAPSVHIINLCLSLPLNIYVIILLFRSGDLDGSAFYKLNQTVTEIIFTFQTPLFIQCFIMITNLCYPKLIIFISCICFNNRFIFQCCVCFERYLAVVHPVTFLKYKSRKYHLVITLFIWVFSLLGSIFTALNYSLFPYKVYVVQFIIILAVHLFFFFSILRVLRRPGPGEKTKKGGGVCPFKKKALTFISFSLLLFLIQFTPTISAFIIKSMVPSDVFNLAFIITININNVTGTLQPTLFLHQMGKLSFVVCKCRKRVPH